MAFVVFDLEYTSWPGARDRGWSGPGEHREIVQIGAVRLDDDFRELDVFEAVVRPRRNPRLSDYLMALTGLTQERVEAEGRDIADALEALLGFTGSDLVLYANGNDAEVIAENCRLADLENPFAGRIRNINPDLVAACGVPTLVSADLPAIFRMPSGGQGHDALGDARNVAAALAKLAAEGRFQL